MIRRGFVTFVLIGLILSLLTLVAWRAVDMKTTLLPDVVSATLDADEPVETIESPSGPVLHVPAPPPENQTKTRVLERPLFVVGLGWDRLAPALLANAGKAPSKASSFSPSGLAVSVAPVDGLPDVIEALARGGGQEQGADVAIVPLPQWLAAQDKLQAIDPVVFYVAGWSHGREAVFGAPRADVAAPDDARPVRVGFKDIGPAYLALFGFDAEGITPPDISLIGADADPAPSWQAVDVIDFEASTRSDVRPSMRWTTSQASGLIPIVMVASRSWTETHPKALVAWLRGWLSGVGEVSGKVAEAARQLGRMDGAPQPLRLMRGLETWEPCSLKENLALFELDGPDAQPLRLVMRRTWNLLNRSQLAAPVPRALPISADIVKAASRARLPTDVGGTTAWSGVSVADETTGGQHVVLTRPLDDIDGYELARELAALGGAFPSSVLRVTPKKKNGPVQTAFELARALSSVPQTVVLADPNPDLSTAATIEVLLAP